MSPRAFNENSGPRAAPPPQRDGERISLNASDVCVGCIVWLPARDFQQIGIKCDRELCCEQSELEEAGYNHPVIVLSIKQRHRSNNVGDLLCSVACVTTYSTMPLEKYLKKRIHSIHHQKSLPIHDPEGKNIASFGLPYPTVLRLEEGRKLHKQSYIRLEHTYEIPVSRLRQYGFSSCRAYKIRLMEKSYKILMLELGMVPRVYHKTNTLYETADRRLAALARSTGGLSFVVPDPKPLSTADERTAIYTISRTSQAPPHAAPAPHIARTYGTTPHAALSPVPVAAPHIPRVYSSQSYNPQPVPVHVSTAHASYSSQYTPESRSQRWNPPEEDSCESGEYGMIFICILGFVTMGTWLWWHCA